MTVLAWDGGNRWTWDTDLLKFVTIVGSVTVKFNPGLTKNLHMTHTCSVFKI